MYFSIEHLSIVHRSALHQTIYKDRYIRITMNEARNVVINLKVTSSIWDYLRKKENYSEFLRNLIDAEMRREKHRGKNKKLSV